MRIEQLIKYVLRSYLPWAVIALLLFSTLPSFLSFNNSLGQIRGGLTQETLGGEQFILLTQSSLSQLQGYISEKSALFDIEIGPAPLPTYDLGPAALPIKKVEKYGVGNVVFLTFLFLIISIMVALVVGLTLIPKKRAEFKRENV